MSEDNKQTQTAATEPPMAKQPYEQLVLPKVICEKHGDVGPHHFTLHAPEFGFDQAHYCLICAMDYINMIAQPVKAVYPEDDVATATAPDQQPESEQKTEGASE
jgi:hypothetical protein